MEEKPVPKVIAWEATRACMFACAHCRANAQTEPDPRQLTTNEAFRMVDEIAQFSKPVFIISGGDPLLRKDIFDVAKRANEKGLTVVMSPSGSKLTTEIIKKIKNSGVRMVSISLDGSNSDVHDGFRNVPGSFEMVTSTLDLLKKNNLPFQINTTITQHNLKDIENIRDFVFKIGATKWDIFMLVPTGRAKIKMEIPPAEYEKTLEKVYRWNHSAPIPIKMTCAPHYMRIITQKEKESGFNSPVISGNHMEGRKPSAKFGGRGCMAGNGFCFVSSIGEVYGCGFLQLKAGDIRQNNFKEIYQESKLFKTLRNYNLLEGRCGICEYKKICGGCRARALESSENVLSEEPYCTYIPKKNMISNN